MTRNSVTWVNASVSGLRTGLGFGTDVLDDRITSNTYAIHKDCIRVAEHVIAPAALSRVQALDQNGWSALARHINNSHNGVLTFLVAFQSRLNPDQISDLLDLQESLAHSLTYYSTFPDIMGVSKDQLPLGGRTPPEMLQQYGCESAAKELKKVCALAKKLSESTDRNDA